VIGVCHHNGFHSGQDKICILIGDKKFLLLLMVNVIIKRNLLGNIKRNQVELRIVQHGIVLEIK